MAVEPRRALVTGGAGFIGASVVEELAARDYDVAVVDSLRRGDRRHVSDEVSFNEVDVRSPELGDVVEEVDPSVIIHLAALHSPEYCAAHVEETVDVNVFGTRNLLSAAREQHNVQRLVFASSASVYPPTDEPCPETLEPDPSAIVGKTKLIGEDLVRLYNEETDVPVASARLFDVYGPHERNPDQLRTILEQVRAGANQIKLEYAGIRRDYVHVVDAARALVDLISHDWGYRVYNVGTGRDYTDLEVAQLVAAGLDRQIGIIESEVEAPSARPHLVADIARINAEIGWEPEFWFPDEVSNLLPPEDDGGE